ncbi:MAG: hypothetical protein HKN72_05530 [Gemmatimonadetes bacterium]|nr:hypothetical protein [Gemmatimonadota bacterium]
MPKNDSRRGATNLGTPLMIVAFVVIGGFMYWLSAQAAAERAQREIDEVPVEDTSPTTGAVPVGDIETDGTPFVGQEVRIAATNVASLLGDQGFWLETPSGNPFLISKGPEVMASGVTVTPGSAVGVVGTVHAMGDSVLTAWTDAGTIAEGDRIVAEFATHFIEATEIEAADGGGQSGAGETNANEGNGASGN